MMSVRYVSGHSVIVVLCAVILCGALVVAIDEQSLTGDGAYHLLAGLQALETGSNTVNLEHPPLAKVIMATPVLGLADRSPVHFRGDTMQDAIGRLHDEPDVMRAATRRARWAMVVVFVIPLLVTCWWLGRLFDADGVVLALLFLGTFSVLPNLVILQTDAAVTLGFVLVVTVAIVWLRRPSFVLAALLGAAFGLAMAVKYSGLLLASTIFLALVLARLSWRRRLLHAGVIGGCTLMVLMASYGVANHRYDRDAGRDSLRLYTESRSTLVVGEEMRPWSDELLAVESWSPALAQYLTGLIGIRIQNDVGIYPSYAFGEISFDGRWWYFPALFVVKTPLVMLVALLVVAIGSRRVIVETRPDRHVREWLLVGVTVAIYGVMALLSSYNLGIRHLMPIVPFLYLPIVVALRERRRTATVVIVLLTLEAVALAPLWMSATNTWWLGNANPTRLSFSLGNLAYKQNFIQLDHVATERDIENLAVIYPLLDRRVLGAYLPEATLITPRDPLPAGWYAVSVLMEQYLPALARQDEALPLDRWGDDWQPHWEVLSTDAEDHGLVAGSFRLLYLPDQR
ncbi:MAG: hypothetical protein AAGD38_11415 [Acidobacteriota bacterium]